MTTEQQHDESEQHDEAAPMDAEDLHPRLPAWMRAHAKDEAKSLAIAREYLDADDRR